MTATTEFPEWQREYWRLLRREKYTYERDAKNRLVYYDDYPEYGAALTDGKSVADEIVNRLMIEQATASCTDEERELLYLVFFEGVSLSAISRQTGVAYRTLGYRLNRTLGKCRKNLEPWRMHRHSG